MADEAMLDRVFHFGLQTFIERGTAPHFTEIAKAFSVGPEEGKALLHDLMASGIPAWLFPDTDWIASFAPFNNLPTQYRLSVAGEEKGYAQ